MLIKPADRTAGVREYYFSRKQKDLDAVNALRASRGEGPVVNLGIGAPDGMPPQPAIDALVSAARDSRSHVYQNYKGLPQLRQAFADWYARYYGVNLNPNGGVQPLVGSKEGILLVSMAFVNPGDGVLVPNPGYPTYTSASNLVGARMIEYDLTPENRWLPDFEALEALDLSGVKLMWVNYPNMPTGAKATPELYRQLAEFGLKHRILIVNDNPYSFVLTDRPLSILAAEGSQDCCLELNSLSKAHNMSGWRLGMIAGSPELVAEVLKVKSQMDSGMFKAMQLAAVEALRQGPEWFEQLNAEYARRRTEAAKILDLLGAEYSTDTAGLFLWGRVPSAYSEKGMTAGEVISERALHKAGVFITPGCIFGSNGNDFIRISLCAPPEVLREAHSRLEEHLDGIL